VKYSQQMPRGIQQNPRSQLAGLAASLLLIWGVGMFGRGYWTPDEPREADIAWRMSWQADKAVPLLAGIAFCEKPPLTYWLAALPIKLFGAQAWAARLPNLLYAMITALSVGLLAARSAGRFAGLVGAATIGTLLLSYQVAIWLATDAPLLAAVSVALLGAYVGFYATASPTRLRGYLLMHAALGVGFLSKSAVAWMVPAMAILTLSIWEKRWRELLRWELYVGLLLQAAMILTWVRYVYEGNDGAEHLKVFFWNNLIGRFASVDAPAELQYAAAHRNFPGKYLLELPVYLFPWTFVVLAAARRAWRQRRSSLHDNRTVRFAIAASVPPLVLLSVAATARNIYLAPALPGVALLVAWWAREILPGADRWDVRALRATAAMLLLGVLAFVAALVLIGVTAWRDIQGHAGFILIAALGLFAAAVLVLRAWRQARDQAVHAQWSLFLAYCALLIAPAYEMYRQVDGWQDLGKISRAIGQDAVDHPLILLAPDETTRAMIDMYARTSVSDMAAPLDATTMERLQEALRAAPTSLILVQLPGRAGPLNTLLKKPSSAPSTAALPWMIGAHLEIAKSYSLPNGRRYALLRALHASI
jgi:4-amino-4-deoxy-L-arabinose transferase-like glycosyltransferase